MIVVYYGVDLSLSLPFCLSSSLLFPHPIFPLLPASLSLTLAPCLAPIFIPIRCLPLSFCLLNCPYPAFFPFRLHLHPPSFSTSRPHPLPASQSRCAPSALALPCLFFSLSRPLPASLPLNLTLCLASAGLFMSSAYAPIFIPLRCLSLSFCILNCPYSASFPFLALRSIPP